MEVSAAVNMYIFLRVALFRTFSVKTGGPKENQLPTSFQAAIIPIFAVILFANRSAIKAQLRPSAGYKLQNSLKYYKILLFKRGGK